MLSVRAAAQVGSKFGDDGARRLYPEYHALVAAMRQQQRASASSAAAAAATAATAATGRLPATSRRRHLDHFASRP